jgi:hypothetical protein
VSATPLPPHVSAECLPFAGIDRLCDRCGATLGARRRRWCSDDCRDAYFHNHEYGMARHQARIRDDLTCTVDGCDTKWDVEVDHVIAARGRHGVHSCVHHLDNLRCLCTLHHRERTAEQRRSVTL